MAECLLPKSEPPIAAAPLVATPPFLTQLYAIALGRLRGWRVPYRPLSGGRIASGPACALAQRKLQGGWICEVWQGGLMRGPITSG